MRADLASMWSPTSRTGNLRRFSVKGNLIHLNENNSTSFYNGSLTFNGDVSMKVGIFKCQHWLLHSTCLYCMYDHEIWLNFGIWFPLWLLSGYAGAYCHCNNLHQNASFVLAMKNEGVKIIQWLYSLLISIPVILQVPIVFYSYYREKW